MPYEFEKLSQKQIDALSPSTLFFFPVGPLEGYGPHLPVGLSLLVARRLCVEAATLFEKENKNMTTVIMPSAPLGIDSNTSKKALTVRSHVLRDWLVDACRSLSRMGFSQFICFSGHLGPKQLTAIEEANKILKKNIFNRFKPLLQRPHLISASSCFTNLKDMIHSPFIPSPPEHGGEKDTSLALLIAPELVDKQYQTLPIADKSPQGFNRWLAWHQKKIDGYWGDPSHATEEKGRIFISDSIKKFKPLLEDILSGKPERSRFRSWYSIVPSNKSFYKAWILFLLSACVMLAWIFFTLKTI